MYEDYYDGQPWDGEFLSICNFRLFSLWSVCVCGCLKWEGCILVTEKGICMCSLYLRVGFDRKSEACGTVLLLENGIWNANQVGQQPYLDDCIYCWP
jgi:hypothetical protein